MAAPSLYVLDQTGTPVSTTDPVAYGQGLLDTRRIVGSDRLDIPDGTIWLQTEFVGVDYDGAGRLWQSVVQWSSMAGQSTSSAHWASAQDATDGHAALLTGLQAAADALHAARATQG